MMKEFLIVKELLLKQSGKSDILESAISFPGAIPQELSQTCDINMEKSDKVKIPKYNKAYKFEFAKPIEKK